MTNVEKAIGQSADANAATDRTTKRYVGIGLLLVIFLWLASQTAGALHPEWKLTAPIIVSIAFSITTLIAFALLWSWVSKRHRDQLTTLYTATSGFRMLAAIFTMLGCYLAVGRQSMAPYIVVFMIYYLVMVGYHAAYFARVTKRG